MLKTCNLEGGDDDLLAGGQPMGLRAQSTSHHQQVSQVEVEVTIQVFDDVGSELVVKKV